MALNMFVGGKFVHTGGGGAIPAGAKKNVDGRSSKSKFDNSHFSVKVWYISW